MTETIVIYGGSFNPSTESHRAVALLLRDSLPVDRVWALVSPQNPFKSKKDMARFKDRVAMAKLNLKGLGKIAVQTIESLYAQAKPSGVIETAETLRNLRRDFEDARFILAMGADNFVTFHTWGAGAKSIPENHAIVVVARNGYTEAALQSESARAIPRLAKPEEIASQNGWYLLESKTYAAATECREELAQGLMPACMRPDVAQYALKKGLYGPKL